MKGRCLPGGERKMSMKYDIAVTVIEFCKDNNISKNHAKTLMYNIYEDLEWENDMSICDDYVRDIWRD